jgi:C1A family cysteine protease
MAATKITYGKGILNKLQAALNDGPVVVAVSASSFVFQLYSTGIITDMSCGDSSTIDHYLLAVGFGTQDNVPYIKLKNSWGTLWGDNGYVYIGADEEKNYCGVLTEIIFPTMCDEW